jgi:hypothetical protein
MNVKPEPAPEQQPQAEPASDDTSEPKTSIRHEVKAADRSARYALITAVAAAVISSFVAAGSAVYVSINQSNRSERLAAVQAIRQDRQNVYSDFSIAMFTFTQQLASLAGVLQTHASIDSAKQEITELVRRQGEFLAGLNLLLMTGSPDMQQVGARFGEAVFAFSQDHLAPFTTQYTATNAPRANDAAGWDRESQSLVVAINDLLTKIGDLNGAFVEAGAKDLQ